MRTIIERLEEHKTCLENQSSTMKGSVERLIFLEKLIKIMSVKQSFCCARCVVWDRNKADEDDKEWGLCHLNNTFPLCHEQDWCYEGIKLTKEQCEIPKESPESSEN